MAHKISVKKKFELKLQFELNQKPALYFCREFMKEEFVWRKFSKSSKFSVCLFLTLKVIGTQTQLFAILWKLWYTKINGKTCHKPKFQKAKWRL